MTKKEKIIEAALELFAREGFSNTSTSKVAKVAGVSEGLIFRHFGNKQGLLKAIMAEGENRAKLLFADIVLETDPKLTIKKALMMGIKTIENEADSDFWKLQYKIKWETEDYGAHKVAPLKTALSRAFSELQYDEPELEAESLMIAIDGLAMRYYLDKEFNIERMIEYLILKYKV